MTHIKALLSISLFFISASIFGQSLNQNWKADIDAIVNTFKQCKNTSGENVNPCSKYVGESLTTVYKIRDFNSSELGRNLTGTEIASFLESSSKWTKIGFAYDQENLNKAQELANAKKAVVAVYVGEDNLGHVSIILPGELTPSGSWGFKVPNSLSLFMNSPQRSYANKGLSYAFTRSMIKNVVLYSRSY